MSVNRLTFSNDLKAKDLCYSDEFFKLKGQKVIPSDSFTFDSYEVFKDITDFKTNNFSNLFLINKQRNSQWLETQIKESDKYIGLATTVSWYTANMNNQDQLGSWLYFSKNYEMFDISVTMVDAIVTYGRPEQNYANYIFYFEMLDDNMCRISHTFGDLTFYLAVEQDKTIHFVKEPTDDKQKFIYLIDGQMVKLYKRLTHHTYDQVGQILSSKQQLYLLGITRTEQKQASLTLVNNTNLQSGDVIAYITNNLLDFDFYIDNSWVGYDRSRYISSVNPSKSAYNLETQALIHHQYNKDDGFNFLPLKNNQTYKGNTLRGNNMTYSDENYPDVDFRTYTSIHSGLNQEKGHDNITLTFNFTDQEYTIEQGDDLFFTIPQRSLQQTNNLSPLWPYKYINLNDTKFIKNGSFGSNVPFFADKVKKMQGHITEIRDENGRALSPNNGTYLCSWLYKKSPESTPIWLDRYYYPDIISRKQALGGISKYNQSFENIIDINYIADVPQLDKEDVDVTEQQKQDYQKRIDDVRNIKGQIHRNTYFDKMSDLVIEPGNTYRYHRLSNEMVSEVLNDISPNKIAVAKNKSKKDVNLEDLFFFDNENFYKLKYSDWNKTNSINLNMDIYLSRKKRMGIQLFGTDYKDGFNIQNRKDLVPFHYYATDKIIYLLNNKYEIVHKFDLGEKYGDTILKIFLGDVFDDVVVVTGIWMYIFSYDLRLKTRIDMTASDTNGKANGIKDLETIGYGSVSTSISDEYDSQMSLLQRRNVHNTNPHTKATPILDQNGVWRYGDMGTYTRGFVEEGHQLYCSKCIKYNESRQSHLSDPHSITKPTKPEFDKPSENQPTKDDGETDEDFNSRLEQWYTQTEAYAEYEKKLKQFNTFIKHGLQMHCPKCRSMVSFEGQFYDWQNDTSGEDDEEQQKQMREVETSMVNYPYGHTGEQLGERNWIHWGKGQFDIKMSETNYSFQIEKQFIAVNRQFISEDTVTSGYELIPSRLSQEICRANPILYKNNLYIPVNQKIMKIIMCPDMDNDFAFFEEQDMGEYPAAARYLNSDEFYLNYTKKGDGNDMDTLSTQAGFIQVENRIKHLFIDEYGKIFGLNYDEFSVSSDGDTIYGLYSDENYLASGGWSWLFNDSMSKMQADTSTNKYAEFASPNSIDKVMFNELGEMCLIRNFRNLGDNEDEENNKRMEIYDKTKQRIYTIDLQGFDSVISLDAYNFIDEAHQEHTCFSVLLKGAGYVYLVRYFSNQKRYESMRVDIPSNVLNTFYQSVNSNVLLRYRDYNALYFNLHVPSHYTYDYVATIKWDLNEIQQGWYNINVMIDLDAAEFEVRINDIIYEKITEKTHSWFKPYVSSNGTTFDSTYYLGCIGKKYGTLLNKILKNATFDPYVCKNSKIDNLSIYNRRLDYYEYQAMRLKNKGINKLLLTLPCGNRNGIDEIVRYFKYNASPSISNKVKINITGTGLQTQGEFNMLRKEIQAVLAKEKDCLVGVKDIEFVEIN